MYSTTLKILPVTSRSAVSLQSVLQNKMQALNAALKSGMPHVLPYLSNEAEYIQSVIDEHRITLPEFDLDPQHLKKIETFEEVDGSELLGSVVFPDRRYRMWVVTFGLPYKGDIKLLQYFPQSGTTVRTVDVKLDDQYIYFKAKTLDRPERDIQQMKQEKETIISFLTERLTSITPELEEYNQAVMRDTPVLFERHKQQYIKDQEALAQL